MNIESFNSAVASIINDIGACEDIQSYMEINCGRGQVLKDIIIPHKVVCVFDKFDYAMMTLIKRSDNINPINIINCVEHEEEYDITAKYLDHINELNKEYNKIKKKKPEIISVEQYIELGYKGYNLKMPYPVVSELENVELLSCSISELPEIKNGIVLVNMDTDLAGLDEKLKEFEEKHNLVMFIADDEFKPTDKLLEVDLTEFGYEEETKRGRKKGDADNKKHLYVMNNGYLVDKYF